MKCCFFFFISKRKIYINREKRYKGTQYVCFTSNLIPLPLLKRGPIPIKAEKSFLHP